MVNVKRPSNSLFRSTKQPQKSLVTLKNIAFAILFLALANVLVRTLFPKRIKSPVVPLQKNLDTVWQEKQQQQQQQQQLRGHQEPLSPQHGAAEKHTDADDRTVKDQLPQQQNSKQQQQQYVTKNQEKHKIIVHDLEGHEEMNLPPSASQDKKEEEDEDSEEQHNEEHNEGAVVDKNGQPLELTRLGTGPTTQGYVVDFVYERAHPNFRQESISQDYYQQLVNTVRAVISKQEAGANEDKITPCEYVDSNGRLKQQSLCRDVDTTLFAYNDANFTRHLCGQEILPHQVLPLAGDHLCQESAHLFPQDFVPVTGHGMAPIQVVGQRKDGTMNQQYDNLETVECDIPCQHQPNLPTNRYIVGTDWQLRVSKGDPALDGNARVEKTAVRQDLYFSSTNTKSSIPLSYYDASKHSIRNRPASEWATAANKASFFVDKECNFGNARRMKWFGAVSAHLETASYGSCGHNTELVEGDTIQTIEGRIELSKRNRIHLAFETSLEKDYITDVVWESLLSGAVPAVLGSSSVSQFVPPNSIIDASGFNSWDKFAEYIKIVAENQTLWETYHKWRTDESSIQAFETRMQFTKTSPECRTCRWAYARMYGLGWDHYQQVVKDTALPRRLCVDESTKLVSQPYVESWSSSASPPTAGSGNCKSLTGETLIGHLKRSLVQHDGIVDIVITSQSEVVTAEDIVMRLGVAIRNTEAAYFPHVHTLVPTIRGSLFSSIAIQDETSKMLVLTSWETVIHCPKEGVVEIVVQRKGEIIGKDETRRIRVITEDTNPVHDRMTEYYPSSYAKQMVKDFVDPIQLFYRQL